MVIAGLVIETLPEAAARVAGRIDGENGLTIEGGDGDRRLAAVWKGETGEALERLSQKLIANDRDVLGIFPTFVGQDED